MDFMSSKKSDALLWLIIQCIVLNNFWVNLQKWVWFWCSLINFSLNFHH